MAQIFSSLAELVIKLSRAFIVARTLYHLIFSDEIGFMGKILIDKLLRSCPGVQNIYILIRPKKGKDIHTRIEEMFDDSVRFFFNL